MPEIPVPAIRKKQMPQKIYPQEQDKNPLSEYTEKAITGARLMYLGGGEERDFVVDKDIFLDAISGDYKRIAKEDYLLQPVAWYRFNGRLMAYNTRRNHWEEWEESACLARAGAALLGKGQQLFIVGGELKPGIRTAEISRITIK